MRPAGFPSRFEPCLAGLVLASPCDGVLPDRCCSVFSDESLPSGVDAVALPQSDEVDAVDESMVREVRAPLGAQMR